MKSKLVASTLAGLFLLGSMASAQAAEISWRVPTSVPEGSPFYQNFLERFAKNVKLMTGDRVEIQPLEQVLLFPPLKFLKR
ncbi:TRAP transporter, DctP family protein [Alcaligenes sp. HPC1271]|nr:TRAP transporter, DctP family protein [Alcaligenes sp. HPC1271]